MLAERSAGGDQHIKPSLKQGEDARAAIAQQLAQGNDLGVKFILMAQGDRQTF